ncbi:MAG: hypothetical protein MJZ55_00255 [Paludibacteraceae bacterium]|nr:hypothetical protein [Paludibacteraceae bacterium]
MIRHEQRATLMGRQLTPNSFNEQVVSWEPVDEIAVIIGYKSGTAFNSENVLTTYYTITGLTTDERPRAQDKLKCGDKTYLIVSIIDAGRKRILNLEEDRPIDD